jgi:hypothetical protein
MPEQEQSVWWVAAMVMLVVAAFGWAFMAAGYAHAAEGWREAGIVGAEDAGSLTGARRRAWSDFLRNAIRQIPNCVAVISYTVTNQIWLPILFAVLEVLVIIGAVIMKRVEHSLQTGSRRR